MPKNQRSFSDSPQMGSSGSRRSGAEPRLTASRLLPRALALLRREETRSQAAGALVRLGDRAIPALIDLLHDDDYQVRRSAAWALGQIKDRRIVGKLIRSAHWTYAALNDPDNLDPAARLLEAMIIGSRPTRVATAVALGRLGRPHAVPDLIEALNDEYLLARLAAIWALGRIGDEDAVPYLADALYDPDPLIVTAAAEALGQIDAPSARKALTDFDHQEQDS